MQTSSGPCLLQQKFAFCTCPPNNLSFAEHGSAWLLTETASSPTPQETEVASVGRGGAGPCEQWQRRASSRHGGCGKPTAEQSVCPLQCCVIRQRGLAAPGNGEESGSQDTGQGQKLFAEKWQIRGWRERNTTVKPHLGCHKLVRSKSRLADQLVIFFFF